MILFHGGCHGCTQQQLHNTEFCYDCQYFEADWSKPSLNNEPPNEAELERRRVRLLKGVGQAIIIPAEPVTSLYRSIINYLMRG
jgi:hypothetical protein